MENKIEIFNNEEFGEVRTLIINDEIWFVGRDVARALGYKNTAETLKIHIYEEDKLTVQLTDTGQRRSMIIINESGLYSLILSSKQLPKTKEFKRWVTNEVLPTIRKGVINMKNKNNENVNIMMEIQSRLKASKDQYNSHGKFKYRSCESILEALKPLLKEYGCHIIINDDIENVGERYYVKSHAVLYCGKEVLGNAKAYAREPISRKGMDESQITGSASSYARKYALNGLFAIDDTKDADTMDNNQPQPITTEQINTLELLQVDMSKLCAYYKVSQVEDLTYTQGQEAINKKRGS